MNDKKRILLGMSGGVDSSTAIILLKEMGYEVIGLTFNQQTNSDPENLTFLNDAKNAADSLNIKHHIIDISKEFSNSVIKYFIEEYSRGRTPNPCAYCNPNLKFKVLLDYANKENIPLIATGHYAKINFDDQLQQNIISKAKDSTKDQTYFLWGLNPEQMSKIVFPLGNYLKSEIRDIAKRNNINVNSKPDSQEICFIPDNDYRKYLIENANFENKVQKGNFIFRGKIKGTHNGYPFYTVGQRKGLGLSHSEPLYVKSIDANENIINLETIDNISNNYLEAENVNLMINQPLQQEKIYNVKIRYRDQGNEAYCKIENNKLIVEFVNSKNSIAIGQSLVIYDGDMLIGGGIISYVK